MEIVRHFAKSTFGGKKKNRSGLTPQVFPTRFSFSKVYFYLYILKETRKGTYIIYYSCGHVLRR